MRAFVLIVGLLALGACADEAAEEAAVAPSDATAVEPEMIEDASTDRRVMIGRDGPQMDACGSMGRIVTDAAVHDAPNEAAPIKARIKAGRQAIACDFTDDGEWVGIVYHPNLEELPDCGTGSPVADVQPYRGACSSGWVRKASYELVAG